MTHEEHLDTIKYCVDKVAKRIPVVAGTGSNCTDTAVYLSQEAEKYGVDGILLVSPYYNKATQKGLYRHFKTVADSVKVPAILYNVPSRTGCNLLPDTVAVLAKHPNVAAIKEASGNMGQVVELAAKCGDDIAIYSGEDGITLPILSMGGQGCISVASNVVPRTMVSLADTFFRGDVAEAARMQRELWPLIHLLFCEVNPIPAKAAVSAMGYGQEHIRLPLTPMEDAHRAALYAEMKKLGVL